MSVGPIDVYNVVLTGLQAVEAEATTAANNVANAATPGYIAETVALAPEVGTPIPSAGGSTPPGTFGGGVSVQSISQSISPTLDAEARKTSANSQYAQTYEQGLSNVQSLLQEPGSNGLSSLFNTFFNDWSTLSQDPQNTAAAAVTVGDGANVANALQALASNVTQQTTLTQQQLSDLVSSDNQYLTQVAQINQQIEASQAAGYSPASLIDQRGQLLNNLANDLGAQVNTIPVTQGGQNVQAPNGQDITTISITLADGTTILSGNVAGSLAVGTGSQSLSVTDPTGTVTTETLGNGQGNAGALLALLNGPLAGRTPMGELSNTIGQDNAAFKQLATLNGQIDTAEATGATATVTALGNQRQSLITQLQNDLNVTVTTVPVTVTVGTTTATVNSVEVVLPHGGAVVVNDQKAGSLAASGTSIPVSVTATDTAGATSTATFASTDGNLGSLLASVNGSGGTGGKNSLMNQIDNVALTLANQVNALQEAGYTASSSGTAGIAFFSASGGGTISASNIEVNASLSSNPALIAPSQSATNPNGDNAAAIAALGGSSTGPASTFAQFATTLGTSVAAATSASSTAQAVYGQVQQQQQSIEGVDTNQEVANLSLDQQTYDSLTNVLSTMAQMVQQLLQSVP